MQSMTVKETSRSPLAIGVVLIAVGLIALASRELGVDIGRVVGAQGWPLFVIVPGLVLLVAAFLPTPPQGLGFAIAGSIVTTVGLILTYQVSSGHWESWAYVWAFIPAGAGLGMASYGLATRAGDLMKTGLRLLAIGLALAGVGWWYFETIFQTGKVPVDLGSWWPLLVIGAGVLTLASALMSGRGSAVTSSDESPKENGDVAHESGGR